MHARRIGLFGEFAERNALVADKDAIVAERNQILDDVPGLAGETREPRLDLARRRVLPRRDRDIPRPE